MTVCDYREYIGTVPGQDISREIGHPVETGVKNVLAAMEFDQGRFKDLLLRTIESYEV